MIWQKSNHGRARYLVGLERAFLAGGVIDALGLKIIWV